MRKSQLSIFASLLLVTLMWPEQASGGNRGTITNQDSGQDIGDHAKAENRRVAGNAENRRAADRAANRRAENRRKVKILDPDAASGAGAANAAEAGPGGHPAGKATAPRQQQTDHLQAAVRGRKIARQHCARCHVIGDFNPMGGISSTPSFILLVREFEDWRRRFETFYVRRPHPAFITIRGIGRPHRDLPANAHPITLSLQAVRDVAAYVRILRRPDAKPPAD